MSHCHSLAHSRLLVLCTCTCCSGPRQPSHTWLYLSSWHDAPSRRRSISPERYAAQSRLLRACSNEYGRYLSADRLGVATRVRMTEHIDTVSFRPCCYTLGLAHAALTCWDVAMETSKVRVPVRALRHNEARLNARPDACYDMHFWSISARF